MNKNYKRILELSYINMCLKLFEAYHPQDVFSFLKSCCIMYQLDRNMIQQVTLKVMRQTYNKEHILYELCQTAAKQGASHVELRRLTRSIDGEEVPKSTYYYKVNRKYTKTTLIMTDSELEVIQQFLYNFKYLGGMV